jgi:toxin ParE1/3/4
MRKLFKVNWAGPAGLDLIDISEFIAEKSPASALKAVRKIRDRVSSLYFEPERGRIVPELSSQGITKYRELIISPWRVVYEIEDKTVLIVVVVDGRRNLEDLLFKRLLR